MFYRTHKRVITPTGKISLTKQSHKRECDIHTILSQYQKTGIITHISKQTPSYQELPSEPDYQASLNLIIEADNAFQTLPAKVRDHFANDPARFLQAFSDPKQAETLREFGLLRPKPPETPQAAPEAPSPSPVAS